MQIRKVQITFNDIELMMLDVLIKLTGRGASATIHDALAFYVWAQKRRSEGYEIVAKRGEREARYPLFR